MPMDAIGCHRSLSYHWHIDDFTIFFVGPTWRSGVIVRVAMTSDVEDLRVMVQGWLGLLPGHSAVPLQVWSSTELGVVTLEDDQSDSPNERGVIVVVVST
jgi:hypothetical protein